jgi:hypothetical protein
LRDGSYLRIKNIQLGYRLPPEKASTVGITLARVYVQASQSLYVHKIFRGLTLKLEDLRWLLEAVGTNYPLHSK